MSPASMGVTDKEVNGDRREIRESTGTWRAMSPSYVFVLLSNAIPVIFGDLVNFRWFFSASVSIT